MLRAGHACEPCLVREPRPARVASTRESHLEHAPGTCDPIAAASQAGAFARLRTLPNAVHLTSVYSGFIGVFAWRELTSASCWFAVRKVYISPVCGRRCVLLFTYGRDVERHALCVIGPFYGVFARF